MSKTLNCTSCNKDYPATEKYFWKRMLRRADEPGLVMIRCISCSGSKSKHIHVLDELPELEPSGSIYIIGIKNGKNTPYKIGLTIRGNARGRIDSMQTGNWQEMEVVFESPPLINARRHEYKLHQKYHHTRVRGEWYKLNKKMIKEIIKEYEQNHHTS